MKILYIFFLFFSLNCYAEVPYKDRDLFKLDDCTYSEKYIENADDVKIYKGEIGTWAKTNRTFRTNEYEEYSWTIDIKNNSAVNRIRYTEEFFKKEITYAANTCESIGICNEPNKELEQSFFISSYNYPIVKLLTNELKYSYEINLEDKTVLYESANSLGKSKDQCERSNQTPQKRVKKKYSYENLDVQTYGTWTYSLRLDEDNGNTYQYPLDGIITLALEQYPIKGRSNDLLQTSNEHAFITATPEELFIVKLTDTGKGMFSATRPLTKKFVALLVDNQIIGVSIYDKYRRNIVYEYSKASEREKKIINWKVRFLDSEKIFIDLITGSVSWGKYDLSPIHFDKEWSKFYLDEKINNLFFPYSNVAVSLAGPPLEVGGEGFVELFSMPDPNQINESPIYENKDPNEIVAAASGSGFFINSDSNIITNNHVVDGCNSMKVLIDGIEYESDVIATDKTNDIALLKTKYENKDYFNISNEDVERSENVKAIGYGFGKNYSSDVKVTAGIVSSLAGFNDNYSEFQMDAAIQSGNSGGPVINDDGDLVGMSVSALNSAAVYEDTGTMPQNVNYAIKASTLKQFLDSNNTEYHLSKNSWFSFGGSSTSSINEKIDNAAVYLSCYMTYAEIEASMNEKAMFENIE